MQQAGWEPKPRRLYNALAAKLKRIARLNLASDQDADDCVQEAWLALLRDHPDWPLDEPRTVAWLCTIVRNKARDCHRLAKRHPMTNIEDPGSIPAPMSSTTMFPMERHDQNRKVAPRLENGLDHLSPVNREILACRVLQGETIHQIAAIRAGP